MKYQGKEILFGRQTSKGKTNDLHIWLIGVSANFSQLISRSLRVGLITWLPHVYTGNPATRYTDTRQWAGIKIYSFL